MTLERLGRQTLHTRRYVKPRAISRFEGDTSTTDATVDVVDRVDSVSAQSSGRDSGYRTESARPASPESRRISDESRSEAPHRQPVDRSDGARVPEPENRDTEPLPHQVTQETVETILERESRETRIEFIEPQPSLPTANVAETEDSVVTKPDVIVAEPGALSREMQAVEERLADLEQRRSEDGRKNREIDAPALSIVSDEKPALTQRAVPAAGHRVEVMIDSIIVNAVPPSSGGKASASQRDPAEGLAMFQRKRKR